MLINYQLLGKKLSEAGLTGKAVNTYKKEEVETLVNACIDSLIPRREGPFTAKPHITESGELVIPYDSDPKYHWWMDCGQGIAETLRELKASDEVWRKYVVEDRG